MSDLKPCPFCGGEAEAKGFPPNRAPEQWVACIQCGMSTETTSGDRCITKWNTRHGDAPCTREPSDQQIKAALEFGLAHMAKHGVDGLSPFKDYPPVRETIVGMYQAMIDAAPHVRSAATSDTARQLGMTDAELSRETAMAAFMSAPFPAAGTVEPVAYVPLDGDKPMWSETHPRKLRDGDMALYAAPVSHSEIPNHSNCSISSNGSPEPSHVMCIGWPTIRRLQAGEAVWFDDIQAGAVAADDLLAAVPLGAIDGSTELNAVREALRDLVAVVGSMKVPQNPMDAGLQIMVTVGPSLDRARAALSRPAHGGWQDISTAPKDGTRVILYCQEDDTMWWAYWSEPTSEFKCWFGCDENGLTRSSSHYTLTHWRPMPTRPLARNDRVTSQPDTYGNSNGPVAVFDWLDALAKESEPYGYKSDNEALRVFLRYARANHPTLTGGGVAS